ncbi:MAG TPA: hypothetical protein VFG23_22630 [Polyangia bacterium]|nr:hypothetical protein [Polyangia bacterium]
MLTLICDISVPLAGVDKLLADDLPFTIARFLTMQAQSGQQAARAGEKSVFKLRNDWTVRNTKITPAKKDTQFSEVYTDTSNHKTGAPDYLPRQDQGGEKVPVAGHRFLAIPTRYLFKYAPQNRPIPDNLRPKALLPTGADIGQQFAGSFSAGARGTVHRVIGKATLRKLGSSDFVAFVQHTKSGTLCIFVRHGGMGYKGGSQDAEPWYTLVREAHIKPRFPMEDLVQRALDTNLDKNFDRAAAEVLVGNALKSGFRVRF